MVKRAQLSVLTGIRFFAALYVVFYHFFSPADTTPFLYHIMRYGYVGVSIFFVLSGFILAYNYAEIRTSIEWKRFWAARFARIYPLYFAALLLCLPIFNYYLSRQPITMLRGITAVSQFGSELTLLQAWTPWTACSVNCPGWSLSVEALFYLVFPMTIPFLTRLKNHQLLVLGAGFWLFALVAPAIYHWAGINPLQKQSQL